MKRIFDVFVSFFGLLLVIPLLLIIAALIRIFLGKPIIFSQVRPGMSEKPFTIYKFRTMMDKYDRKNQPLADGERLTKLGIFLRKTSLDELPELFNVLKGDMSLVGPRPLLMQYLPLYSSEQRRRHEVKPGITGWAQVNGRNALDWEKKFSLDVWYVDNNSFRLDLKILFMTLLKVFLREGISHEDHVTMEEFRGSLPKVK